MRNWSTIKNLIWLHATVSAAIQTVTGNAPLTLSNAIAKKIKSLTQTGLCTQASTPTPSAPVPIKCNNGEIKWDSVNKRIYVDGTPEVLTVTDSDSNTQTASVENLFAISTYADEQEVIGGVVTHNVGVKALDGAEGWTISSNVFIAQIDGIKKPSINVIGLSTHYKGTSNTNATMSDKSVKITYSGNKGVVVIKDTDYSTKAAFSAYLAAQYAAGTPVIVVYPLATPTTEQVAKQPLTTAVGTNTVSVTAEVSPLAVECKYHVG